MKRTKLLALALVVAVVLMGAGYAAWQETLTINHTVSTGELDIEYQNDFWHPINDSFDNDWQKQDYFGYTQFNQDEDNDLVTLTINNMYPGSVFFYELKAKNVGSIPATISDVVVDLGSTSNLFDENMRVGGYAVHRRANGHLANYLPIFNVKLSQLQNQLNNGNSWFNGMVGWELQKGDYITFDIPEEVTDAKDKLAEFIPGYDPDTTNCLFFYLPYTTGNDLQNETLPSQQFDIKINFKQFNQ